MIGYIFAAWLAAGVVTCFWLMIPQRDDTGNPIVHILIAALWPVWLFLAVRAWWRGEPWPPEPLREDTREKRG